MTQPTPYRRGYDFSDAGGAQPPGGPLDDELDDVGLTLSQILRNMALLQRDDTGLRNGIVGIDALDSRVLGLISGGTFSIAGTWATGTPYPAGAFLTDDGAIYLVMEAHTSTSIVDDLAAGRIAKALQNEQGTRLRDDFVGNAVQTEFSLSQSPARPTDVEVYVDGALVLPDDYVQTGATVTFDVAPANGAKISVFSITWATAPPIQTLVDAVGDRNLEISAATQFLDEVGIGGAALVGELDARPTTAALGSTGGFLLVKDQRDVAEEARLRDLRDIMGERSYSPTDYEGVYPDGSGDSSYAMETAIQKASANNGSVLVPGQFLVGEQIVDSQNMIIAGRSAKDKIIVKSGTLGFDCKKDWVHFRDLSIVSEGNKADGLGTSGIKHYKGSLSTGHIYSFGLRIEGFSGIGMEVIDTLDFQLSSCFFMNNMTSFKVRPKGSGPADFSTTMKLNTVYSINNDIGMDVELVRRSSFENCIIEWNRIGMVAKRCEMDVPRGYFENNSERGLQSINSFINEIEPYYNDADDAISRTWPDGVVLADDRYWTRRIKGDYILKRLGLTTNWALDERFLEAWGDTVNRGILWDGRVVPTVRGSGVDLFNPNTWASETGTELKGWNAAEGGFEISGSDVSATARGMRNTVTLDNTKQYVLDWRARLVSGTALNTARVGADIVTNGVPFTPTASGSNIIKLFGVQSSAFESYIKAFTISPVVTDKTIIADLQQRLSALPTTRNPRPVSAPPASTAGWAAHEFIPNSAPTVVGTGGSQYVVAGWRAIGGAWVEARELTGT